MIKLLDNQLINQIAAGEVIERPASVVKELIENSLDANATRVIVNIEQGGQVLIRVRDDGVGISEEELPLALQRHATSKIRSLDDLEQVQSLGFRGEALASIAAISRCQLISRTKHSKHAAMVQVEGGIFSEVSPTAHPIGTTIEVRDLFFNTPARRKFLKTAKTEINQVETVIQRLSLSHFNISVKLTHNERDLFDYPSALDLQAKEQRVYKVLGESFMQHAVYIEHLATGLSISGWVANPSYTRSQPDMQHWYVNGRMVKDKLLTHAVRQAFQDVLFHGRFPAFLLYLEIDPTLIDVNVHPTKQEVRFREGQWVHDFILKSIQDVLRKNKVTEIVLPETEKNKLEKFYRPIDYFKIENEIPILREPEPIHSFGTNTQTILKTNVSEIPQLQSMTQASLLHDEETTPEFPLGFAVAQLHQIYILAQNSEGLVIVDMHAAHERVLYEKMKTELDQSGIIRQALLIPIVTSLNKQEMEHWIQYQDLFNQTGIVTEAAGPMSVMIREVPANIIAQDLEQLFHDVLSDLMTHGQSARITRSIHEVLGTIACRSALRAQCSMSIPAMNALLRQMEKTQYSGYCNHGRPSWVQFNLQKLDKLFLRGQ